MIFFELLDTVFTTIDERSDSDMNWSEFFNSVYFIRFALDFVSCMVILYLMHAFGPTSKRMSTKQADNSAFKNDLTMATEDLQDDLFSTFVG